ncbi:MAG TPA: hypothetical protein DGG95_00385 [Cytophagales bacterium]|jgi:hypothetical protein|nr:hypothetical protein [Cytophagales bacterium]
MKKLVSIIAILLSCSDKPSQEKYIVTNLPAGIRIYNFHEAYNKPTGQYILSFTMKNETGNKIDYPQINVDLYLNEKHEGTATSGPGTSLENNQEGTCSILWIFPNEKPDKLIFKFIKI